jgi:hypothetical protein
MKVLRGTEFIEANLIRLRSPEDANILTTKGDRLMLCMSSLR